MHVSCHQGLVFRVGKQIKGRGLEQGAHGAEMGRVREGVDNPPQNEKGSFLGRVTAVTLMWDL